MLDDFHLWIEQNRYEIEKHDFAIEILEVKDGAKPSINLYLTRIDKMVRISIWKTSEIDIEILNSKTEQCEIYKYWEEIQTAELVNVLNKLLHELVLPVLN